MPLRLMVGHGALDAGILVRAQERQVMRDSVYFEFIRYSVLAAPVGIEPTTTRLTDGGSTN